MTASPAGTDASLRSLLIVGTGLIGTSIGLAARAAGIEVWLDDVDDRHLAMAMSRGAGARWPDARTGAARAPADHAIVCVPPTRAAQVIHGLQRRNVALTYSDTASVKANVIAELEVLGASQASFVGGHPMAGRERGGPLAGRGDLFVGRTWVLTPTDATSADAVQVATSLAQACGAVVEFRSPAGHDRAVALVSHIPQLLASVLASSLADAPAEDVALTGQALRDLTRIADSDPDLWTDILEANGASVAALLRPMAAELDEIATVLEQGWSGRTDPRLPADSGPSISRRESDQYGASVVTASLRRGRIGRARLPGRHGGVAGRTATVSVVVPDRPGQLYAVLGVLADAQVNVDDMAIDHARGQPTGVVDLAVGPDDAARAIGALERAGWSAHEAGRGDQPLAEGSREAAPANPTGASPSAASGTADSRTAGTRTAGTRTADSRTGDSRTAGTRTAHSRTADSPTTASPTTADPTEIGATAASPTVDGATDRNTAPAAPSET